MKKSKEKQSYDYHKVEKVLRSCRTMAQMDMAGMMVYQFDKMYNDASDHNFLDAIYNYQCKRIREEYATD